MTRRSTKGQQKSSALTLRITPRNKYGLELMARIQHRTLSSVIDWVIERTLHGGEIDFMPEIRMPPTKGFGGLEAYEVLPNMNCLLDLIWSPFEHERVINLATKAPNLMTYEESLIWSKIQEQPELWNKGKLNKPLIKACWDLLNDYANSEQFDENRFESIIDASVKSKLKKDKAGPFDFDEDGIDIDPSELDDVDPDDI